MRCRHVNPTTVLFNIDSSQAEQPHFASGFATTKGGKVGGAEASTIEMASVGLCDVGDPTGDGAAVGGTVGGAVQLNGLQDPQAAGYCSATL